MKKRIISFILILALAMTAFSVAAFADDGGETDLGQGFELRFDGESWRAFAVESLDEVLTIDDLKITVVDREGNDVPADAYELSVENEVGWDEENDCPLTEPYTGELKISGADYEQAGFIGFYVIARAKDGSGYTGSTRPQEFMIWHRYSFNWFGANATFGEKYKRRCTWSWHDYFEIPVGDGKGPEVYGIAPGDPIDPQYYTLTYFNRVTGVPVSDGDDYQDKVYPETEPLGGMPTEPGAYFVRIDGKEPYYGTSYIDFNIVAPVSFACFGPQKACDGETLYLPVGGEMYVNFDLDPYNGLIPGWRNDLFKQTGFEIDDDPTFFEDDDYAYAHIKAGDKTVGDKATLYYNWYRPEDIFGEGAPGWVDAEPVYSASVVIEVAEQPETFVFLKDDDARYFDGDTVYVLPDSEFWLCTDLTYSTGWWLGDRDLSDLEAKGFTYIGRKQFEVAGYVYDRFSTEGLAPGTAAEVSIKCYDFDDYFSGDLSDKESCFPATVRIEVMAESQPRILGDADGNGKIQILDATAIQRKLAGLTTDGFAALTADTNQSGKIDIIDATLIQRWLAGFDDETEIGDNVNYSIGFAYWNIEEELLPEGSALTGADAERAREEIRKALSLLIDRNAVVATQPGNRLPASSFVPKWVSDANGEEFHKDYYSTEARAYDANVAEAVATLKKYYTFDEVSGKFTDVPTLTYLINEVPPVREAAEEIQRNFAAVGIELVIDARDWDVYFDALDERAYSFARAGWGLFVDDPMQVLESFRAKDNNCVGFGHGANAGAAYYSLDLTSYGIDTVVENGRWSQTYDVLITAAKKCKDRETAYALMHLAEDMLMSTGCIMPLFYN